MAIRGCCRRLRAQFHACRLRFIVLASSLQAVRWFVRYIRSGGGQEVAGTSRCLRSVRNLYYTEPWMEVIHVIFAPRDQDINDL